ncbi:hypothetical protein [Paenibacillus apiarius]|uniref:Uncharacterized protein n=1 Tax=Paenibacillus apiarius TaxID=46240 RepID=A0ABT4DN99_9BACL|nr:hypothetical protein [Paenibacillus apiarius]MCY9515428.1 hypothetical protein [Paenibacillus apiarius]MCY9518837.1 hypothetical protein [Paenibacillus apiarius]MCY9552116.1 hypothetical protein [Paenibacillus apiarius]MCY9557208.1 hypothetical protein [Paenibacillus apiarius]MCY9682614.1 hypothetical protein [Paenibacillus apiarius]
MKDQTKAEALAATARGYSSRHLRMYAQSGVAARLVNKLCTHALLYGAQNKNGLWTTIW